MNEKRMVEVSKISDGSIARKNISKKSDIQIQKVMAEKKVKSYEAIRRLYRTSPNLRIRVNADSLYLQVARYGNNPDREKELRILQKALWDVNNPKFKNARYARMSIADIITCFGDSVKMAPKNLLLD